MAEKQEGIITEYAGFWMRLGAYLLDGIVLWIIYAILGIILWIFTFPIWAWGWAAHWEEIAWPFWLIVWPLWSLVRLVIPAAYFVCFWAWRGETPGMMALRIRVVHTDGTPLDWGWRTALLRFLGYIVCWITLGLLFLWIAFDGRKQGIHDKMAETYVVKLPERPARLPET